MLSYIGIMLAPFFIHATSVGIKCKQPNIVVYLPEAWVLLGLQDVVASLASDKNVWEAVMKNKKLVEFYKTSKRPAII